ncbi:uncharacterized protein BJX67DRAFT_349778 [Aspergillus lucknowensis]|uniref:Uncharacterized protein n=1 Tax=Aspergillus lucknowensis TaxID=176173 RepID=A0ABR4LVX4_9EURO
MTWAQHAKPSCLFYFSSMGGSWSEQVAAASFEAVMAPARARGLGSGTSRPPRQDHCSWERPNWSPCGRAGRRLRHGVEVADCGGKARD